MCERVLACVPHKFEGSAESSTRDRREGGKSRQPSRIFARVVMVLVMVIKIVMVESE
jgi:hypothetical protein